MKILYISKSVIPSRTANSVHVMKMCHAFANNGNEVVLLAPEIKSEYEKNVIDIYQFYGVKKNFKIKKLWHPNFKFGAIFYTLSILFYLLANKKFNLVYGRFLYGCFIATFLKKEVIFETHNSIHNFKNYSLFIFNKLIKNKYFKKLIVISNALKRIYLQNENLSNDKIIVAHDGADEVSDFNNRISLFGEKNSIKIGYVGHLYKGRGIELIIECAKQIKDMTFHIVGGLDSDIEFWKKFSKNLNVLNIFFYGFVPPKQVASYQNSFDIVLAPYSSKVSVFGNKGNTSEFMSPLKIFEYMSFKKPIIASDLPVLREVLSEKNSILVEPENINSWVNAINYLRNKENRENIANTALKDFKNFTWKSRATQIINQI